MSDYYRKKLSTLKTHNVQDIKRKQLAERVYYMYLAQQEQIDELTEALRKLDPKAKIAPAAQPLSGDSNGDPCCCENPQRPPECPPICVSC